MASDERPIAVLGATGYTGRLVCEASRELGVSLRLLGRDERALRAAAQSGEEVAVADAADQESLIAALEGAFAVVSTAGPFLERGVATVDAAIEAGAHYIDSSTEQAYARLIYERFGTRAADRGLVLLTAFAQAPGDLAAAIAADGLGPLDEIVVASEQSGLSLSSGSRRTLADVMSQPQAAFVDGRLLPSRFGATTRRVRFPGGKRLVVEWGGPEPLTVPRHAEVRNVRSYARAPRVAGLAGRFSKNLAPLVRLSAKVGGAGPSPDKRRRATFTVVAEARGPRGGRRATILGRDVYGTAGLLLARAAHGLASGDVAGTGALAPAEAFEPRSFLGASRRCCSSSRLWIFDCVLWNEVGSTRMRLRPLTEAECYARCYGAGDENVRSIRLEPRPPRLETRVSGEELRQAFEQRLDGREPLHDAHEDPAAAA